MAKSMAIKNGFDEAIFIDKNELITEGSSSNFWILDKNKNLVTRSLMEKF